MKYSLLLGTVMAVAAAVNSVTLLTTDSPDSPAHIARAILDSHIMTCSEAATDKLIFEASMSTFQNASETENPSMCIWTWSDSCSWRPRRFNFSPSCERLNFGYRNTKMQGRFTSSMKTRIDDNFKKDLYEYCARFSSSAKGGECRDMADWYIFLRRRLRWVGNPVDFGEDAHDRLKKLVEVDLLDIKVDADIEGQKIPEPEEHGEDVDDLDAWFGPTRCYMKRHGE
ncbi:hypothetical protein BBAD15_g1585 [Beauveria bassiana D1-5]|uniref:Secretory phospholipase A2 n=2 Tax=Beauveria bassiana TaxID=176275 RepID=A0A0A2W2P2_BEABA|nr:hypothetical protein BBAD15_g1585 [Beauveria bassiana D1-5]